MSNMVTKNIKPILKDERGMFFEVINSINIKHVVVTTFHKGAIRGNQFRKNMDLYFFLTTGKIKLVTQSTVDHLRKETIMTQGSLAFIPRGIAFAFYI